MACREVHFRRKGLMNRQFLLKNCGQLPRNWLWQPFLHFTCVKMFFPARHCSHGSLQPRFFPNLTFLQHLPLVLQAAANFPGLCFGAGKACSRRPEVAGLVLTSGTPSQEV
jgi:hypothetical protein